MLEMSYELPDLDLLLPRVSGNPTSHKKGMMAKLNQVTSPLIKIK